MATSSAHGLLLIAQALMLTLSLMLVFLAQVKLWRRGTPGRVAGALFLAALFTMLVQTILLVARLGPILGDSAEGPWLRALHLNLRLLGIGFLTGGILIHTTDVMWRTLKDAPAEPR